MNKATWFEEDPPLTHRLALYLPSLEKSGKPIKGFDQIAEATAEELCGRFGGVTRYPATGYFRGMDGTNRRERIEVLESFCAPTDWERESIFVRGLVKALAGLLRQESIACSLDGRMAVVKAAGCEAENEDLRLFACRLQSRPGGREGRPL